MPRSPRRPCAHPGCPRLVEPGAGRYCEAHGRQKQPCANPSCPALVPRGARLCPTCDAATRQAYDDHRGSAGARGYDRDWDRLRNSILAGRPLCEQCETEGRVTPAALVHHRVPITQGGARLDPANLEALCASCHAKEHRK